MAPADLRQMTTNELDEFQAAEKNLFWDNPCLCSECCRAGVDDRPVRFVPTLATDDEEERAYNPRRDTIQIAGHWAHGLELLRWYQARAAFAEIAATHRGLRAMPVLLRQYLKLNARALGFSDFVISTTCPS